MFSFYQLTVNESLKLMKKRGFFIPFLIMLLIPLGIAFVVKSFMEDTELGTIDFIQSVISMQGGGMVYVFLCIIYMSSLVSSEYQLGTIKLLLIRSHSRSKILASKFAALILFMLALMIFSIIASAIIHLIFFGINGEGEVIDVVKAAGYSFAYTIIYSTIAFMFSIVTKSTGATIGITFMLVFVENIVIMLLSRYSFAKYILFFNTDLQMYEEGEPIIAGMSFGFSVTMLAAYMVAFLAISFYVFKKRDVS